MRLPGYPERIRVIEEIVERVVREWPGGGAPGPRGPFYRQQWIKPNWLLKEWACCGLIWQLICVVGRWPERWSVTAPECPRCRSGSSPSRMG